MKRLIFIYFLQLKSLECNIIRYGFIKVKIQEIPHILHMYSYYIT